MTKVIYIAAAEGSASKRVLAVGLVEGLLAKGLKVGIFRPVVTAREGDSLAASILEVCKLEQTFEDAIGCTYGEVAEDPDGAIDELVAKMGSLRQNYEAIVVIGSNFADVATPVEVSLNARIAANLDAPAVLVVSGRQKDPVQIKHSAQYSVNEFRTWHNTVLGIVATRVNPDDMAAVQAQLNTFGDLFTTVMPENSILSAPTVQQQLDALGAHVVKATPESLRRESLHVAVSGMTLPNLLTRINDETTLAVASDRIDLLPGLLLSQTMEGFPRLAALILVGGYEIPDLVTQLIDHGSFDFAIAAVDADTFSTAETLAGIEGLPMATMRKIDVLHDLVRKYGRIPALLTRLDKPRRPIRTQAKFEYDIAQQARSNVKTIVLPESGDPRILHAASICQQRGLARLILLGDEKEVLAHAKDLGHDLTGIEIVSPHDPDRIERYASAFAELRREKNVTIEMARAEMATGSYFGTMMVQLRDADAMVSGAVHTTADTIRPALQIIKTRPGLSVVSGALFMCMPDQVLLFADCAVNPNPTPAQLADIAISSAESAIAFGIDPRIAMLSYSTGNSGAGPDVDAVVQATRFLQMRRPDLISDGPIQFDAAVDPETGKLKMPGSPVAGQATVFIFPDLESGNIAYKAVQRSSGAVAIGPILQGLNKTVTDLSRGATVEDIVSTIAITAVQAQADKV